MNLDYVPVPQRFRFVHLLPLESAVPSESGIFSVPLCLGMTLSIACKAASRSSSLVACGNAALPSRTPVSGWPA